MCLQPFSEARSARARIREGVAVVRLRILKLPHFFRAAFSGEEGVIGVVVFPLAVTADEHNVVLRQPFTDDRDILRPSVIVNDVRKWHIHHVAQTMGSSSRMKPTRIASLMQSLIRSSPSHGQRLLRAVRDFAGESETAGGVAMRARVALHEDAVEDGIFRIINPVFIADVLAADADVDAFHRRMPQCECGLLHFGRCFLARHANQDGQWHGGNKLLIVHGLASC